jgi:hypothetical protein
MNWDYLNEQADHRIIPIAKYLKGKTKDKFIVDLDCLEGRILKYLEHDYMSYKGNDLITDRFIGGYKATIKKQKSKNFVKTINKCDILLVLGFSNLQNEPREDVDLADSVIHVVMTCKPEIIVLECWLEYKSQVDKMKERLLLLGYKVKVEKTLGSHEEILLNRYFIILER